MSLFETDRADYAPRTFSSTSSSRKSSEKASTRDGEVTVCVEYYDAADVPIYPDDTLLDLINRFERKTHVALTAPVDVTIGEKVYVIPAAESRSRKGDSDVTVSRIVKEAGVSEIVVHAAMVGIPDTIHYPAGVKKHVSIAFPREEVLTMKGTIKIGKAKTLIAKVIGKDVSKGGLGVDDEAFGEDASDHKLVRKALPLGKGSVEYAVQWIDDDDETSETKHSAKSTPVCSKIEDSADNLREGIEKLGRQVFAPRSSNKEELQARRELAGARVSKEGTTSGTRSRIPLKKVSSPTGVSLHDF